MLRAVDLNRFRLGLIDHVMIDMAMGGKSTSGLSSFMQHNFEALVVRRRWLGAGLSTSRYSPSRHARSASFPHGRSAQ